jgi:hypothetical protein
LVLLRERVTLLLAPGSKLDPLHIEELDGIVPAARKGRAAALSNQPLDIMSHRMIVL